MWEYNTPNYLFLLFCRHHQSAHSRDNHQFAIAPSVPHVRFQLSRVANCNYMIVLWDSWRRLMRSCVQVEDRCLPQRRTRRGARTEGAVPIAVSSIVVAVAALAVAADVFAIRGLQVAARTKAPPSARSGNSRPTSEPKEGVPAAYGSVGQGSGRSVPIEGQRCTQRGNRSGGRGRELAHGFFGGTELSTTSATRQRFGGTVIASYLHGHRQVIGTNLCPCAVSVKCRLVPTRVLLQF